mmetsp:Transcript_1891/g.4093  ORF Transcript_1891/g.4093 Transcript_1891/m.4093 type:complete len:237 (+) Transcript_1891:50-760(+)
MVLLNIQNFYPATNEILAKHLRKQQLKRLHRREDRRRAAQARVVEHALSRVVVECLEPRDELRRRIANHAPAHVRQAEHEHVVPAVAAAQRRRGVRTHLTQDERQRVSLARSTWHDVKVFAGAEYHACPARNGVGERVRLALHVQLPRQFVFSLLARLLRRGARRVCFDERAYELRIPPTFVEVRLPRLVNVLALSEHLRAHAAYEHIRRRQADFAREVRVQGGRSTRVVDDRDRT